MTEPTLKDDPDLKLPQSVRNAAARSEELHRMYRDQPEGESEVTQPGNADTDAASFGQQAEQPAERPAPTSQAQPSSEAEDGQSWEHKYKSIHGRYVRQQDQLKTMAEQIQNLNGVIATMQATAAAAPAASQVPQFDLEQLTSEEAADYGDDFLRVVGKRAKQELAPVLQQLLADNEAMKKRLEGVTGFVQQDSSQKLLSTLDAKLPDWREMNTNQEFLNWLGLPDPYSGGIRHDMLKAAYAQGNASRVLAFFNGFLAEEAAVAPAKAEPDTSETVIPKVPLANFAAPGRAKTAAANTPPAEKPIITRAQVSAFYAEVAQGKYRGKEAEKARLENMIFAAQSDGRIR